MQLVVKNFKMRIYFWKLWEALRKLLVMSVLYWVYQISACWTLKNSLLMVDELFNTTVLNKLLRFLIIRLIKYRNVFKKECEQNVYKLTICGVEITLVEIQNLLIAYNNWYSNLSFLWLLVGYCCRETQLVEGWTRVPHDVTDTHDS